MIITFADSETEDIFDGSPSRKARRRLPEMLWKVAQRKLDLLNRAQSLADLRVPPGNMLETLRGNRKGQHSIRINAQYRICFLFRDGNSAEVEIVDYH